MRKIALFLALLMVVTAFTSCALIQDGENTDTDPEGVQSDSGSDTGDTESGGTGGETGGQNTDSETDDDTGSSDTENGGKDDLPDEIDLLPEYMSYLVMCVYEPRTAGESYLGYDEEARFTALDIVFMYCRTYSEHLDFVGQKSGYVCLSPTDLGTVSQYLFGADFNAEDYLARSGVQYWESSGEFVRYFGSGAEGTYQLTSKELVISEDANTVTVTAEIGYWPGYGEQIQDVKSLTYVFNKIHSGDHVYYQLQEVKGN